MTVALKQFETSVVTPKDDSRFYDLIVGASGIVEGCEVSIYASNQLKVSDGWGIALGRIFTVEEEIVVANTVAANGRILVNIDLENVTEPAKIITQSAAALPAIVQQDTNHDGTVFQLALATYPISSNTVSTLTDARMMLSDAMSLNSLLGALVSKEDITNKNANNGYCGLDAGGKVPLANLPSSLLQYQGTWNASTNTPALAATDTSKKGYIYVVTVAATRFSIEWHVGDWLIYNASGAVEKSDNSDEVTSVNGQKGAVMVQDIITSAVNRLFYGSGTSGTLNQLAFPATSGSVLRQDTSGAPYWDTGLLKMQSVICIYNSSSQNFAAGQSAKINFNTIYAENDPLGILSLYGNGVRCGLSGFVEINSLVDFTPNSTTTVGFGYLILYKNGSLLNFYAKSLSYQSVGMSYNFPPFFIDVAVNDYLQIYLYTPVAGSTGNGFPTRLTVKYVA